MSTSRFCIAQFLTLIAVSIFGGDAPPPKKLSVAVSNLPAETPPSRDMVVFMTQFHQLNYQSFERVAGQVDDVRILMIPVKRHGFVKYPDDQFERVSLIDLTGKEPIAYSRYNLLMSGEGKAFADQKNEKRAMSNFEIRAIAELKKGRDIIVELENPRNPGPKDLPAELIKSSGKAIYTVGAMYAKKSCLECHQVKEGTLMGAMSYRVSSTFVERAIPKKNEDAQGQEKEKTK